MIMLGDTVIAFDVDETLCIWEKKDADPRNPAIPLKYYGKLVFVTFHKKHIEFLNAQIKRNRTVLVWSGNGVAWTKTVIDTLIEKGLITDADNLVLLSKPEKYIDDVPCSEWMGPRLFLKDE